MPKQKKIKVEVNVFAPRCSDAMAVEVEIDPNDFNLGDKPTVSEVVKAAEAAVLDKLKFKLTDGRGALKEIKAARKEAEEASEENADE